MPPRPHSSKQSPGLFSATKPWPEHHWIAHVDGGARGNPGPAGYGVTIDDSSGKRRAELSEYLGHKTNNVAEYSGLVAALDYCLENGCKALQVISDSELIVKQMNGVYKVKHPELKQFHERAREMASRLEWFRIEHVLRERNHEADRLANAAMDRGMGRSGAALPAREINGIVQGGRVQLLGEDLPEGTMVTVRVKR
jgi:ribonuclease HI